jgi:GTPase SAR1 family protein
MPTTTALKVTRPRKTERRQKKVTRNVFLCYVVGAAGSGKTSLLRSFLSKRFRGGELGDVGYEPTSRTMSAVNSVEMGGGEKYLVVSAFAFTSVDSAKKLLIMSKSVSLAVGSCKNSDRNTRARSSGAGKGSTWPTSSSTFTIRVMPTRFLISPTSESVQISILNSTSIKGS